MRVVFINHSVEAGGAELALLRLLRTEQPWQAALILPPVSDAQSDAFADLPSNVDVRRGGTSHHPLTTSRNRRFASIAAISALVRSGLAMTRISAVRHGDVLVANTTRSSVYVSIAALLLRKPVIVHIRDMIEPEVIGSSATRLMRRFVLPRAAGVIANSSASLSYVLPYLSQDCETIVLPSPSGLRRHPIAAEAPQPDAVVVGMVARIDPWKGQALLIRAFARARADTADRLRLIGGAAFGHDRYRAELGVLAQELGVADRVEFTGHVDDVTDAIQRLDICVQCSLRPEPLGQNVLQYLAGGKASIVSAEGGPAEWVTDGWNGLTFPAGDERALAEALKRLCESPSLRRRLSEAAVSTPGLDSDQEIGGKIFEFAEKVVRR